MKHSLLRIILGTVFSLTAIASYAEGNEKVEEAVKELVKKYDEVAGVDCMTVVKGEGLNLFKSMFNKQFGRDFMKGVTSITFIDYSSASQEVCDSLHKDMDVFLSLLKEFDTSKDLKLSGSDYVRAFASEADGNSISDFVIDLEDKGTKMVLYMAGKIICK